MVKWNLTTEGFLMCVTVGPDKFSFDEKECYLFESAKNSKKNTQRHNERQVVLNLCSEDVFLKTIHFIVYNKIRYIEL